ncbi:PhoX family protein [Polaromonas sp. P1(28)-8]|nr:PhoX family protein [Polaromonas sp. P1(28)-8]
MEDTINASRRSLLKGGTAAAAIPFVATLQAFAAQRADTAQPAPSSIVGPYGPIRPTRDLSTGLELLQLPAGFSYRSLSWTGDLMANGQPTPRGHDGMAVVAERNGPKGPEIVLIRNHELGEGAEVIGAGAQYDRSQVQGGTTNITFRHGTSEPALTVPSLGGTLVNCAGGVTPWGTWLTCEETIADRTSVGGRKHGYVFEVTADPSQTTGQPIVEMGRFSHEAVAVDPATSIVYLTQDDRNKSGLYRFIPRNTSMQPGALAQGGTLQAARVKGQPKASLIVATLGDTYELEWVNIQYPDADPQAYLVPDASGLAAGPFVQAWDQGALRMSRGEGAWYFNRKMYFVDTSTGRDAGGRPGRGEGAVWELDLATMRLKAIFVSGSATAGNNPDNITVSPRGGVLLCEDGGGVADEFGFGDRLMGLMSNGASYIFAKNNVVLTPQDITSSGKKVAPEDYHDREFAGACFDAKGQTLFVNIQTPGITFAIWGPWARGTL